MEHRNRDARGRRSMVLAQIAVCIFFFLALATMPIVPSTEARVPTVVDGTPVQIFATPVLATPAATPLPGQTTLDKYTVALYRFDDPARPAFDDTWRYPGTLNDNASITNFGLYRDALWLDGQGANLTTPNLPALSQGTLEAFIDFQYACRNASDYYSIIGTRAAEGGDDVMLLRVAPFLKFGIYSGGEWTWANSGINPCRYLGLGPSAPGWPYETWRFHHVAGTWGPRGLEIWVDGVLHGVGNDDPRADLSPYKYMCNPQMQLGTWPWPPNPVYPDCPTPVIVPRMTGVPPGDYYGGIPSVSLVVGCGPDRCFNGRIDEIRVSNVQRTFSWTIVPTVTPTPTQTPVSVVGEYSPDSNTAALYHLSEDAWYGVGHFTIDAVNEQWDAGLEGNAALTPGGRFGSGMELDGSLSGIWGKPTYLQMNTKIVKTGATGTFEAWVNLASDSEDASPFFVGGNGSDDLYFGLYPPGHVAFRVNNGSGFVSNDTHLFKSYLVDSWHHLAATWGDRGLEVWFDGMLCNRVPFGGKFPDITMYTAAGCDRNGNCMKGRVDEVRLSKVQRTFSRVTGLDQSSRALLQGGPPPYSLFFPLVSLAQNPCGPL